MPLDSYFSACGDAIPPSELLIKMALYVLKYNYFSFDIFLQISDTAMGLSFAPNFANLFMGFSEHYVCNAFKNPFCSCIIKWYRYIDDIFCIFLGR